MTVYQSFDEKTEIIGQNVLAFIQNIKVGDIRPILERHQLVDIDPTAWYPLSKWLDVLTDISNESDSTFNFVAIGMAIAQTAVLPPEVENMTFEEFMFGLDTFYQMQHRNGDAGTIKVEKPEKNHLIIKVRVPYPDDLEYGTAYGFAKRFLPRGTKFIVKYDENTPRREEGGEYTIIHITW